MGTSDFRDKFAIVGLGLTKLTKMPGYTPRALETEAARLAIEDAGLKREDIDGAVHIIRSDFADGFPRVLGLPINVYVEIKRGGCSASLGLLTATSFLQSGIANYVVVATGDRSGRQSSRRRQYQPRPIERWEAPFGQLAALHNHALFGARHMHDYGTTSRQMGAVAVAERSWACLNPAAYMYGRPISIEDHQNSPWVTWPFHLLDCCLVSEGGAAFIVTTAERAKNLRKPPLYIMGIGFGEHVEHLWWEKGHYSQLPVQKSKENAFRQAGIELKDIDVAALYDCFTIMVISQLEDYGWCKKGEGGAFVEEGHIGPGGDIPVNTGGGLHSWGHLADFIPLAQVVMQLRGEAGAAQVKDAEIALFSGHGGEILWPLSSGQATTILRR